MSTKGALRRNRAGHLLLGLMGLFALAVVVFAAIALLALAFFGILFLFALPFFVLGLLVAIPILLVVLFAIAFGWAVGRAARWA